MPIRLLSLAVAAALSGCALTNPARDDTQQAAETSPPARSEGRTTKHEEPEFEDEWGFVGKQTRTLRSVERDPDRWFKKYVQSPRARAIERNLGIE